MLAYVHSLGWMPRLMAAFSAGRPKASHPMGCRTLWPRINANLATASPPGEGLGVAHVQVAGGVGEHVERVELGPRTIFVVGPIQALCLPGRHPFGLDRSGVVLLHDALDGT